MVKINSYEEFCEYIKKVANKYLAQNYTLQKKWADINNSFTNILASEKKMRRHFSTSREVNQKSVEFAKEFEKVYNESENAFISFYGQNIIETKRILFNDIKELFDVAQKNKEYYPRFLDDYFGRAVKTKNDYIYCLDWFSEIYKSELEKEYDNLVQEWISKKMEINYTNERLQVFKFLFACLDQLIIEDNSYKNFDKFSKLKSTYPELNNDILFDFVLNFCDRNTTMFQYGTLEENVNKKLEITFKEFIFKKYSQFFPSAKLITEVRNLLEHRTNSFNLDLTIIDQELMFFISANLVMMILISALHLRTPLNFENII